MEWSITSATPPPSLVIKAVQEFADALKASGFSDTDGQLFRFQFKDGDRILITAVLVPAMGERPGFPSAAVPPGAA